MQLNLSLLDTRMTIQVSSIYYSQKTVCFGEIFVLCRSSFNTSQEEASAYGRCPTKRRCFLRGGEVLGGGAHLREVCILRRLATVST